MPNSVHSNKIEHPHATSVPNGTVMGDAPSSPHKPKKSVSFWHLMSSWQSRFAFLQVSGDSHLWWILLHLEFLFLLQDKPRISHDIFVDFSACFQFFYTINSIFENKPLTVVRVHLFVISQANWWLPCQTMSLVMPSLKKKEKLSICKLKSRDL